ncbi:HU family DNA-binding protein, partial [Neobacillus cucumis]|uniref:HU family DNA-binding protein n=1 Tax=Neobacillus cucumis TaxID=1740721 RepID=UPI00360AC826
FHLARAMSNSLETFTNTIAVKLPGSGSPLQPIPAMAPMKKAVTAMSKGAIADALAAKLELKKTVANKFMASLAEIGTAEVKKSGIFTVPGLCRIKTKKKPATKAGKREMFGKTVIVKAKPAKTVVKAFAVAALKASI